MENRHEVEAAEPELASLRHRGWIVDLILG